jgi:hypothetical protein
MLAIAQRRDDPTSSAKPPRGQVRPTDELAAKRAIIKCGFEDHQTSATTSTP